MNPILSQEIRGRFRDKRSFWLLFGVSLLLGIAATLLFASATSRSDYTFSGSIVQAEQRSGRELFRFLALGNILVWLLIAPALTATGLAKERERGLLESLWLSPFRVSAQIRGRIGAALCFLLILQVATLPIYGIAVLLGGVSLFDIAMSGFIIAMGAFTTASFGLFCSARSYRGSSALGAAFLGVVLWSVVAWTYFRELVYWPAAVNFLWFPVNFNALITFTHPVALLWILLSPDDFASRFGGPTTIISSDMLIWGLIFQLVASLLLLWSATRKASKPLPDMAWSRGNERLNKRRDALNAAKTLRKQRREAERASQKVAGALLYELPIEKFVRFKDPLLSREVRGRFRLRQSGTLISLLRAGVFIVAIGFWLFLAFNIFDPASRRDVGQGLALCLWGFGTLAIGVLSSGAVVREREAGTWEGLHLSLLSPLEIVRSKWLSPLISLLYWSAPLLVFLPWYWSAQMAGALLVVAASLASVSAWGFFISSRAPHSAAATSWTLGTLLVALVAVPALGEFLGIGRSIAGALGFDYLVNGNYENYMNWEAIRNAYHPVATLQNLFSGQGKSINKFTMVALNLAFNTVLTTFLLWRVWRRLKRSES